MKSNWVMTEEEKMDKKLRAVAKKTPDGTPIQKAKPSPKKSDTSSVPPPAGTLQSYMARRKMYLHRKRRQNQQSTSTATSSTLTPSKMTDKNKFDRNDPLVKLEMNSFDAFEHENDSSIETSFIKMEQDDNYSLSDRKRHSTANTDRMESYGSSSDENSYDDSYFTKATRVKVDTALNSIATSPGMTCDKHLRIFLSFYLKDIDNDSY